MEVRREEVAGGFVPDREARMGDDFPARVMDRDREPPFEESLRAVPRAEAFDGRRSEPERRKARMARIECFEGEGEGRILRRRRLSRDQESSVRAAVRTLVPSFFATKSRTFPPSLQPKQYQAFFMRFT